jgi:hypothetical protein
LSVLDRLVKTQRMKTASRAATGRVRMMRAALVRSSMVPTLEIMSRETTAMKYTEPRAMICNQAVVEVCGLTGKD